MADLYFRRGECLLAEGKNSQAQTAFARARDLDTLRFRCDSRMNEIIRDIAAKDATLLADTEKVFSEASKNGVPGGDFFYEHVHLKWEGNWLMARTIAEQVAKLLPAAVTNHPTATWPNPEQCARSLGWTDWGRRNGLALMLGRLQDPPFTHQLNHSQQIATLTAQLEQLTPALSTTGLTEARNTVELAAKNWPEDPTLQMQLTELRRQTTDLDGAISAARRVTELLPHAQGGWLQLGLLLTQAQRNGEAATALTAALRIDPDNVWALQSLAQLHAWMGRDEDALQEFNRVLELKPRLGLAHLGIGRILEIRGRFAEADEHYRLAVQNRVYRAEDLTTLGRFCLTKGWFEAAVTNLQDALKLSPNNPALHRDLAEALAKLGHNAEAEQHRAAIAQPDNASLQLHFRRGLEFGRLGKPAEAAEQFREVVRLMPALAEGHLNLAVALEAQGLNQEALEQFREVLRLSPTNQSAAGHIRALEARLPAPSSAPEK
ncbi:MAG: tetratricopeptide repeat protein [Verrucomicrobiota bacterium]